LRPGDGHVSLDDGLDGPARAEQPFPVEPLARGGGGRPSEAPDDSEARSAMATTARALDDPARRGNRLLLRPHLAEVGRKRQRAGESLEAHPLLAMGTADVVVAAGVEPPRGVRAESPGVALQRLGPVALLRYMGSVARAAAALGISKATLYNKIKRYRLTSAGR
jgi:hypothetical protein